MHPIGQSYKSYNFSVSYTVCPSRTNHIIFLSVTRFAHVVQIILFSVSYVVCPSCTNHTIFRQLHGLPKSYKSYYFPSVTRFAQVVQIILFSVIYTVCPSRSSFRGRSPNISRPIRHLSESRSRRRRRNKRRQPKHGISLRIRYSGPMPHLLERRVGGGGGGGTKGDNQNMEFH